MAAGSGTDFTQVDPGVTEDEVKLFEAPPPAKTARAPAPLPMPVPLPRPTPVLETDVAFRSPTIADIDRLWDWIRADDGAIAREFAATSSIELHQKFAALLQHEKSGHALVRSVDRKGDHVGFGSIFPIQGGTGVIHLYLAPDRRGSGVRIGREALKYAKSAHPGLKLISITSDPRHVAFLGRIGLTSVQYFVSEAIHAAAVENDPS